MTATGPTPLAIRLARQVRQGGPMRVAEVMATCLTDPEHGYYTTRDPLGTAGDFTTAPEISQMFGELLGLWTAQVWLDAGAPAPFVLAELGPGRGTLMADMLRATCAVPGFHAAAQVHLVETSPVLREIQARTLNIPVPVWVDTADDLPRDLPLFAVANEFFDALPIHQFLRTDQGWAERMVGLDDAGGLSFGLAQGREDAALDRRFGIAPSGTLVETCPAAEAVIATLAARVAARGGAILAVDYGDWVGTGDTLQALANHAPAPVLATAGEADVTAHVGFRWLAEAAAPLAPRFTTQGLFLERLGITQRAQALAQTAAQRGRAGSGDADDPVDQIVAAHRRLTHPDEMGTLFKVLSLTPADRPAPPGMDP